MQTSSWLLSLLVDCVRPFLSYVWTAHDIVLSEHLLREIHRNLVKRVRLPKKEADQIIALLRQNAIVLEPEVLPTDMCRDPDDVPILGLALAASADCVVTGDNDLLVLKKFRAIPILTPRDLSDIIHKK